MDAGRDVQASGYVMSASPIDRTDNPFGNPEDWKPLEDAFDRMVKEAFPDASPVDKYGAGITFNMDGTIDVSLNGKTVRIVATVSKTT